MATSATRDFTTLGDSVENTSMVDISSTAWTVTAWFRADAIAGSKAIIGNNGLNDMLEIRTSKLGCVLGNTVYAGTTTLSSATWYFGAVSIDAGSNANVEIYYSTHTGALVNDGSHSSANPSSTSNYIVGKLVSGSSALSFVGQIGYCTFNSQVLSPAQLLEVKNNSLCTVFPNADLFQPLYYDGSIEYDLSGSGNDGTVNGADLFVDGPPVGLHAAMAQ